MNDDFNTNDLKEKTTKRFIEGIDYWPWTKRYYYCPKWLWNIDWIRPLLRKIWPHKTIWKTTNSNNEVNQWACIKDQYLISPIYGGNGRVLVQEDPYKSKYECTECSGTGHTGVICKYCKGTKYDRGKEENGYCRDCTVGEGTSAVGRTLGFEPCPTCNGKGGTIVIPDENQRNTTTGQVLAISNRDILEVKVGDKVMFTNYSGSPFKFMDIDLRIIVEKDLLGKVKQLRKNVDGLNEGNFADLDNIGIAR